MGAHRKRKTHCKNGHEFTESNIYWTKEGWRKCRACALEAASKKYVAHPRPDKPISADPTILAYAAGIVDGEGSIMIRHLKKQGAAEARYHGLTVSVSNTDLRLIDWLCEHFGGNVNSVGRAHIKTHYKRAYGWSLQSRDAELFLRAIREFMVVKGEQADVAFELRDTMGRGSHVSVTDELHAKREEIRMRMKALNARGAPPEDEDVPEAA